MKHIKTLKYYSPDTLIIAGLLFGLGGMLDVNYHYLLFFSIISISVGTRILIRRYLKANEGNEKDYTNK